jgi:uncharacterized protein YjbI with pentapeptide repeats
MNVHEIARPYADLRRADLRYADLRYADLRYADLREANLRYADLREANLRYADLRYADLRYADLRDADLTHANLTGTKGLRRPKVWEARGGWLYAYKAAQPTGDGSYTGPLYPGLTYRVGETVEVANADESEAPCGRGINFATLDWCRERWPNLPILRLRFRRADVASVPYTSDGKFRVKRATVVGVITP